MRWGHRPLLGHAAGQQHVPPDTGRAQTLHLQTALLQSSGPGSQQAKDSSRWVKSEDTTTACKAHYSSNFPVKSEIILKLAKKENCHPVLCSFASPIPQKSWPQGKRDVNTGNPRALRELWSTRTLSCQSAPATTRTVRCGQHRRDERESTHLIKGSLDLNSGLSLEQLSIAGKRHHICYLKKQSSKPTSPNSIKCFRNSVNFK